MVSALPRPTPSPAREEYMLGMLGKAGCRASTHRSEPTSTCPDLQPGDAPSPSQLYSDNTLKSRSQADSWRGGRTLSPQRHRRAPGGFQRQHLSTEPPAVKGHLGPEEETRPRRHQGSKSLR